MDEIWRWLTESTGSGEFEIPISFTLIAYFTFGITGALAALRRGYDIIGVLSLAMITASGGGLIRDGLLISSGPPSVLLDARPLVAVAIATFLTLAFQPQVARLNRAIAVIDAIGLGAFAVHGVQRSLEAHLSVPAAILGGTITAVGGGLMRDILVREEPLMFKPGQFYALVAIGGSALFIGLVRADWTSPHRAALITIGVVFAVRMLAIRFNWHTRALYRDSTQPPQ